MTWSMKLKPKGLLFPYPWPAVSRQTKYLDHLQYVHKLHHANDIKFAALVSRHVIF